MVFSIGCPPEWFYAPYLNQFIQPDPIVPDPHIPQDWNRYTYVRGNPINYIDPGGMCIDMDANGECDEVFYPGGYSGYILANFDETEGKFTKNDKDAIESALWDVGMAYSKAFSAELTRRVLPCLGPEQMSGLNIQRIDPVSALKLLHGDLITFKKIDSDPGNWGITSSARLIYIYKKGTLASVGHDIGRYKRFAVHEMAHAFENALLETLGAKLGRNTLANGQYKDLITPKVNDNPKNGNGIYNGFAGGSADWQWRIKTQQLYEYEVFADMYLGWVYDTWEKDPGGNLIPIAQRRSDFMKDNMEAWVYKVIQVRLGRKVD